MRKILTLFFAFALVFAFTLPAQAAGSYFGQENFGMRGYWYTQGFTTDNMLDFDDDANDSGRWAYYQFRWYFDTNYDQKYGGTVGLEMDEEWGNQPGASTDFTDGGDVDTLAISQVGAGRGDDQIDVEVKHAYIWFMIPGTPVKVTSGLQSFIIDPDLIMTGMNGDWFGVRVDVPVIKGVLNVTGAWMKSDEGANFSTLGTDFDSDDSDIWYINASASLTKWLSGGTYHVWLHVRNNGYYPLDMSYYDYGTTSVEVGSRLSGGPNPTSGFFGPGSGGDYLWHGVHVSINPKPFYSRFHFNYFWGSMDDKYAPDLDPSGFAFVARAGVNLPPFSVGIRGWYFSGNDDDAFDPVDPEWNRWTSLDSYFGPTEIMYNGPWGSSGMFQNLYAGKPGGQWALMAEGSWQATPKLKLNLNGTFIWATNEEDKPALAADNSYTQALGYGNSDNFLGVEIDGYIQYFIYPNLRLHLGASYLFAGSGLDHVRVGGTDEESADDAYELFYRLQYTF
jgi:hypothetical protein